MEALSKSAGLFEVSVPDYKQLKACHKEVRLLKELWDMIVLVRFGSVICGMGSSAKLWTKMTGLATSKSRKSELPREENPKSDQCCFCYNPSCLSVCLFVSLTICWLICLSDSITILLFGSGSVAKVFDKHNIIALIVTTWSSMCRTEISTWMFDGKYEKSLQLIGSYEGWGNCIREELGFSLGFEGEQQVPFCIAYLCPPVTCWYKQVCLFFHNNPKYYLCVYPQGRQKWKMTIPGWWPCHVKFMMYMFVSDTIKSLQNFVTCIITSHPWAVTLMSLWLVTDTYDYFQLLGIGGVFYPYFWRYWLSISGAPKNNLLTHPLNIKSFKALFLMQENIYFEWTV